MTCKKGKSILLVEDNQDDADLTIIGFKQNHVTNNIIHARNGAEALDYLFREGEYADRDEDQPQLVLLDLKLPKIDGLEVLRRIRGDERTRMLPVVILTSSRETQDLTTSYNLGVNAYVRKPIDFSEFAEAIKQLGFFWLILNEVPEWPSAK